MTNYIDYTSLSATQRLHFNNTGECPREYLLTEAQFKRNIELLCGEYSMKINDEPEVKAVLGMRTEVLSVDCFV